MNYFEVDDQFEWDTFFSFPEDPTSEDLGTTDGNTTFEIPEHDFLEVIPEYPLQQTRFAKWDPTNDYKDQNAAVQLAPLKSQMPLGQVTEERSRYEINEQRWNEMKSIIHDYHVIENHTLAEVMSHLEKDHHFIASKSQYVRKLRKWNFKKYGDGEDWSGIHHALKRRDLGIEDADVYLRDKFITPQKLRKEISRRCRPSIREKYTGRTKIPSGGSSRSPHRMLIRQRDSYRVLVSPPPSLPWYDFADRFISLGSYTEIHNALRSNGSLAKELRPQIQPLPHFGAPTILPAEERSELQGSIFRIGPNAALEAIQKGQSRQFCSQLAKHILPLIPEQRRGSLLQDVEEMLTTHDALRLFLLTTAYVVHVCTNDSLQCLYVLHPFLKMLSRHELMFCLRLILRVDSISSRLFEEHLLRYGICAMRHRFFDELFPCSQSIGYKLALLTEHIGWLMTDLTGWLMTDLTGQSKRSQSQGISVTQCCCATVEEHEQNDCVKPINPTANRTKFYDLITYLLDVGAEFDKTQILALVIGSGGTQELAERLLRAGASVRGPVDPECNKPRFCTDPLLAATYSERVDIVRLLVRKIRGYPHVHGSSRWSAPARNVDLRSMIHADSSIGIYNPLIYLFATRNGAREEIINIFIEEGIDISECVCDYLNLDLSESPVAPDHDLAGLVEGVWGESSRRWSHVANPLQTAAAAEDLTMVKWLISRGASTKSCHGIPALVIAALIEDLSMIGFLLDSGANPDVHDEHFFRVTALMVAVAKNHLAMVALLLMRGASISQPESMLGDQGLFVGFFVFQNIEGLEILRAEASSTSATCLSPSTGQLTTNIGRLVTCFEAHLASAECRSWITSQFQATLRREYGAGLLEICLKGGCNPNEKFGDPPQSPIVHIFSPPRQSDSLLSKFAVLLSFGAKIDLIELSAIIACNDRRALLQKVLLSPECLSHNLQFYINDLQVALNDITDDELFKVIPVILCGIKGKDQNPGSSGEETVLLFSNCFHVAMVLDSSKALFKDDTYINCHVPTATLTEMAKNRLSRFGAVATPLNLFLAFGPVWAHELFCELRYQALQHLLEVGADVNNTLFPEGTSWTPLQLSCAYGCVKEVSLLLQANANVNTPPYSADEELSPGRTALQAAAEKGDLDLVELLIATGADVNDRGAGKGAATALELAVKRGFFRIMQVLLEAGADINNHGSANADRTIFDIAAENMRLDSLKYLLNRFERQIPLLQVCTTAAGYAKKKYYHVIADWLLKYPSQNDTCR